MRLRMFHLGSEAGNVENGQSSNGQPPQQVQQQIYQPVLADALSPQVVDASILEIRKNSTVFSLDLLSWARVACALYWVMLGLVAILIPMQEKTGMVQNNRRLSSALTQTVGVRTPRSVKSSLAAPTVLFDPLGKCSLYNGINSTASDTYIQPVVISSVSLDARYLIIAMLICVSVFQLCLVFEEEMYYLPLLRGNNHIAVYFERSISMPLIVVTLCAQVGMTDLWTILSLMFNAWGCMIFCFFAEVLFQCDGGHIKFKMLDFLKKYPEIATDDFKGYSCYPDGVAHYHAISMLAAWVLFVMTYFGVLSNISTVDTCFFTDDSNSMATGMVIMLYFQVAAHGFMLLWQTLSLYAKYKPTRAADIAERNAQRVKWAIRIETIYLFLDVFSKLTFAALGFFGTITN